MIHHGSIRRFGAPSARFVFVLALCLLGAGRLAGQQSQPEDVDVREEVTVSEASVLVDFGEDFPRRRLTRVSPEDVVVLEEGVPREVIRLQPVLAAPDDQWQSLVYFDTVLSSTDTIRRAARALGEVATALTQIGEVRVVVADPGPREVLRTRSAVHVQDAMADIARDLRGREELAAGRRSLARRESPGGEARREALRREVGIVRSQNDRLLRLLGEGCPATACSLFWVSDGFDVRPARHFLGDEATPSDLALGEQVKRSAVEVSDSLSALERVTIVPVLAPPREVETEAIGDPHSGYDLFLLEQGSYFDGIRVPLGRRTRRSARRDQAGTVRQGFDALIDPTLEPLRIAAEESSGVLVRSPERLLPALQSLALRYRVWFRTTRVLDGQMATLEAQLRNGRQLHVPRWAEASTPHGVAAARARGAFVGEGPPGDLELVVERKQNRLEIRLPWSDDDLTVTSGLEAPIRVTAAVPQAEGVRVVHRTVSIEEPSPAGDTISIELPEDLVVAPDQDLAVHVEDLRFRIWGRALLRP